MSKILNTYNLSIGYNNNVVLNDLNISLKLGELACLVGLNGTGKSTLIYTLSKLLEKIEGKILINEVEIENIEQYDLSKLLSLVLTNQSVPSNYTVFDIISLGRFPHTNWLGFLTKNDKEIIDKAIELTGLQNYSNTQIYKLSDGFKQKVMIARAIAQDTKIILLDEPTAHLDLYNRIEIINMLRNISHDLNKAILLSTHDLLTALDIADKLLIINNNKIYDSAPEDHVLNNNIEEIFKNTNVNFNKETGNFKFIKNTNKTVCVNGDGIAKLWTLKALNRVGYSEDNNSNFVVNIINNNNSFKWKFSLNNTFYTANNIYELTEIIK